jgi:hypothetical protein
MLIVILDLLLKSHANLEKPDADNVVKGLIEKLGDNKIMIRQLASEGLKSIAGKQKPLSLLQDLVQFLNSAKWHIREEILEFIIVSFIQYGDALQDPNYLEFEFDYESLLKGIVKLLHDDKPKIVHIAFETCATISHIGSKSTVLKILKELTDTETFKKLLDRIEAECIPRINTEGVLEFPYIANELTTQNSFFANSMMPQTQANNYSSNSNTSGVQQNSRFTSAGPTKKLLTNNIFEAQHSALKRPQTDNMGVFINMWITKK